MKRCTCTLACIPQGITDDQTCRMSLDGPDEHDCETAAHLRSCGFCRAAVYTPEINHIAATLNALFSDGDFWRGSEPYRIWHRLPEPTPSLPSRPKRRWWQQGM